MKDLLQRLSASIKNLQEYEGEDLAHILKLEFQVSGWATQIIVKARDIATAKIPVDEPDNSPLDDDSEQRTFDPTR